MPKPKQTKGGIKANAVSNPRATDILFGRGGHVNHHKANQYYLELVSDRKDQYQNCKKVDKASIAWDIIRQLQDQTPCPRFLKKDYSTGLWHVVKDSEVRRKISQCLRERAAPVLPKKNKAKAKQATKSTVVESHGSSRGKDMGNYALYSQEDPEDDSPRDKRARQREISEGLFEIFSQKDISELCAPPTGSQNQEAPLPALVCTPQRQVSFHAHQNETSVGRKNEEAFVPPPMPLPVPIPQSTRLGETARAWSDYLTGSFASFTPSIFDATGTENAWENLLDPSALPQLCNDDDDESFPGSLTSDEASVEGECTSKQASTETLPASNCQDSGSSPAGLTPSTKKSKSQYDVNDGERLSTEPISVDSFFSCDVMSLGKVLETSRLNSYSAAL